MSVININTGIQQKLDGNSRGYIGGDNTFYGNKVCNVDDITDRDWEMLKDFFVSRQLQYEPRSAAYQVCGELVAQTKKKNAEGIKSLVGKMGKSSFEALLGVGVNVAVRTVLSIITGT